MLQKLLYRPTYLWWENINFSAPEVHLLCPVWFPSPHSDLESEVLTFSSLPQEIRLVP